MQKILITVYFDGEDDLPDEMRDYDRFILEVEEHNFRERLFNVLEKKRYSLDDFIKMEHGYKGIMSIHLLNLSELEVFDDPIENNNHNDKKDKNPGYKKSRFTDDEIERANNIDLLNYAINQGLHPKKVGPVSYHIKGYGGLYINPEDNTWYCFSRNKGGGPIQFVMLIKERSWVEAMKELLGEGTVNTVGSPTTLKENNQGVIKDFQLPEKNSTYKHMIAYLIQTRQIDKEIVYKMIKENRLYEDKNQNCVFVGYNKEGDPKYANRRGTNTNIPFKGEIRNSDKSHPFYFGNSGDKVYVFESPIDALSHATIFKLQGLDWKSQYRLSLGGLAEIGLDRFLSKNPGINNITLCLDNDEAGKEATERISNKYKNKGYQVDFYNIAREDVNEELIEIKKNLSLNNRELIGGEEWQLEA